MVYKNLVLILLAGLFLTNLVSAIGVTPPRIVIDEILKDSSVEQTVRLVDIEEGTPVSVQLSGEGSEWVSVKNGREFIFSDDTDEVTFLVDIPEKAPNGEYKVSAQILTSSKDVVQGSNTASVVSGIMVEIKFGVSGDEHKDYSIRKIFIHSFEVGTPLTVTMDIKNNGNVLAKPDMVELDIKDKVSKQIILSEETKTSGSVEPFQAGESIATFNVDLEEDFYFGDVRVHTNNGIIEETDIPFDVLPEGSLASNGELTALSVQENVEDLAKITALFENTGEHGLNTIINLDIFVKGVLKDTIKTEPQYVRKDSQKEFVHLYEVKEKGEHTIKAYAEFNGKKSNEKEVTFEANPSGGLLSNHPIASTIIVIIILLILAYLIYVILQNKKKKDIF